MLKIYPTHFFIKRFYSYRVKNENDKLVKDFKVTKDDIILRLIDDLDSFYYVLRDKKLYSIEHIKAHIPPDNLTLYSSLKKDNIKS